MSIPTFRTWVKINGFYPIDGMAEAHRSKDRLVLHIGRVVGHGGEEVPEHSISIEMAPVLPAFPDASRTREFRGLAESEDVRCAATLSRDRLTVARCQLEQGHAGDHVEAGCGEYWDNWPPQACIRWPAEATEFVPYDADADGAWTWEEDGDPPDLSMPYTGRLADGVLTMRKRWQGFVVTHEVPLPDLDTFLSHRQDVDPLTLFMDYIGSSLGGMPEGKILDPARLFMRGEDYERLVAVERFWAKGLTGDPLAAWAEEFNASPGIIESIGRAPTWSRTNVLYVAAGAIASRLTHAVRPRPAL